MLITNISAGGSLMVGGSARVSSLHRLRDPLVPTGVRLRWGIVGPGAVARKVAADLALLPDAEIVAVAGRSAQSSSRFAEEFGIPIFVSGDDAVDRLVARDDIDVVYVATPHSVHAANAIAALKAGKHVLLEKPFTVTAAEADAVIAAARASRCFLMEALWTRFLPTVQRALAIVHSGEIGTPHRVVAELSFPVPYVPADRIWSPLTAGGALLEMGPYPLTWATSVFGAPARVDARSSFAPNGVDSETIAILDYAEGGRADLSASFLSYGPSEATVIGSRGWLRTARPIHSPRMFTVSTSDGSVTEYSEPFMGNGYIYELREVMACIRAGEFESAVLPLAETRATMRILDEVRDIASVKG